MYYNKIKVTLTYPCLSGFDTGENDANTTKGLITERDAVLEKKKPSRTANAVDQCQLDGNIA